MTEMLSMRFANGKFLERRDYTYSVCRQAWKKHLSGCSVCMQKFMEAFRKTANKKNLYRTMPYRRSREQDKKTDIFTCTFLCGVKCTARVAIATEPLPVKQGRGSGRRVKVARNGETVVREEKYLVSDKRRMITTSKANFIKEAKKVFRSLYESDEPITKSNVAQYASREMKQEHHSWILANCPYEHIQNWIEQSSNLKRTYRGVQVLYFEFPRQNHNELFKLVRWLEKIVKYE